MVILVVIAQDLLWFHRPRPRWQPPPLEDGQTPQPEPLADAPPTLHAPDGDVVMADAPAAGQQGEPHEAPADAPVPAAVATATPADAPVPAAVPAPVPSAVPTTPLKLVELRTLTWRGVVEGWKQVAPSCSIADIWAKVSFPLGPLSQQPRPLIFSFCTAFDELCPHCII